MWWYLYVQVFREDSLSHFSFLGRVIQWSEWSQKPHLNPRENIQGRIGGDEYTAFLVSPSLLNKSPMPGVGHEENCVLTGGKSKPWNEEGLYLWLAVCTKPSFLRAEKCVRVNHIACFCMETGEWLGAICFLIQLAWRSIRILVVA